ncbi:MAG: GNAT family N-acetyltransferase [Candidatus Marinimicrobia bacterium]|nr:GNAT family N-acetyltransferase [Candidatus Neomarinimicrobiota bacterium]
MKQLEFDISSGSKSRTIASSGVFKIELIEHVGEEDFQSLIDISRHLAEDYGQSAILTKNTIHKYFNKSSSLPFIARYRGDIIGYIIGIPLEELGHEPWARIDENFGKHNTMYTYAFVIMKNYKSNGYAKMLKRVYLSWAKKRAAIRFITGHVRIGVSSKFTGDVKIINRVENWNGTCETFEYYRRDLRPDQSHLQKHNPPLEIRI